jgi:hypothetical protein
MGRDCWPLASVVLHSLPQWPPHRRVSRVPKEEFEKAGGRRTSPGTGTAELSCQTRPDQTNNNSITKTKAKAFLLPTQVGSGPTVVPICLLVGRRDLSLL